MRPRREMHHSSRVLFLRIPSVLRILLSRIKSLPSDRQIATPQPRYFIEATFHPVGQFARDYPGTIIFTPSHSFRPPRFWQIRRFAVICTRRMIVRGLGCQ